MKLTEVQIHQLYKFTEKHYVDWYDVQTELVDHLANGIEEQWQEDSKLTFEDALSTEFKKFGIMGFGEVIEEKTKALNSRYRKLVWGYFADFFKLPKIILTLFLVWCFYQLFQVVDNRLYIVIPIVILLFCIPMVHLVKCVKSIKKAKKETGKKWLFDNITLHLGELAHVLNIGIYGGIILDTNHWNNLQELMFSVLIVVFGLTVYISIFIVSPQLKEDMAAHYPEYKFT